MPPVQSQGHEWTKFELQTLLSLIARGSHLEQRPNKRTDAPSKVRKNAHEVFYTAFNTALHGKDFTKDINKREVTRMLEQVLEERKHVVGKGGLVERQTNGRITRTLSSAWRRPIESINFDGSLSEWEQGRKERVLHGHSDQKKSKKAPVDGGIRAESIDGSQDNTTWAQADNSNRLNMDSGEARFAEMTYPSHQEYSNTSAAATKNKLKSSNGTTDSMSNTGKSALGLSTAKDGYTPGNTVTPSKQKRAGRRTRVLSSPRVLSSVYARSSGSEGDQTPTPMPLSHENYKPTSLTGRHVDSYLPVTGPSSSNVCEPSTPKNQLATQDRRSSDFSNNSTNSGIYPPDPSDSASAMDVLHKIQTPITSSPLGHHSKPSGMSAMAAFNVSYEKKLDAEFQMNTIGTGLYAPGSDTVMNRNQAGDFEIKEKEANLAAGLQSADESEEE
ncbi:hypothetical protein JHW43_001580 [Diplocarpon mali]|nr:hypothetical protein JHW43_001580 [Diplocarpon mali]